MGPKKAKLYRELRTKFQEQGDEAALEEARALVERRAEPHARRQGAALRLPRGRRARDPGRARGAAHRDAEAAGPRRRRRCRRATATRSCCASSPRTSRKKIRTMPTDPARVRRSDPGNPEKCPVWNLHQVYSDAGHEGLGREGLHHRGHRLPRVQAAGDRRDQRGDRSRSASAPRSTRRTRRWCATSSRTAARRRPTSPTRRCATCARPWASTTAEETADERR